MRAFYKFTLSLLALGCLTLPRQVLALELNVTDNGNNTSSEVNVSSESNTTVSQSNNTQVENTSNATSNTGDNVIANSEGGAVQTGNSTTQTNTVNNVGSNVQATNCCPTTAQSEVISEHGAGGVNAVNAQITSTQNITATNSTTIVNNIKGTSSTGNNRIHDVSGNATIKTGTASITIKVSTVVNTNIITVPSNSLDIFDPQVINNTSLSQNEGNSQIINGVNIHVQNSSNLINLITADANTGGNSIKNVGGTVSLLTGNSSTIISVSNTLNKNVQMSSCCKAPEEKSPDQSVPNPTGGYSSPSSSTSSGGTGGVGGVGGVLATSTGFVLPATGSNMSLWATIFNVFMLLFGLYLRRTAGRSPTK